MVRRRDPERKPRKPSPGRGRFGSVHAALGGNPPTREQLREIMARLETMGLVAIVDTPEGSGIVPTLGVADFLRIALDLGISLSAAGDFAGLRVTGDGGMSLAAFLEGVGLGVSDALVMLADHAQLFPDGGPNFPAQPPGAGRADDETPKKPRKPKK